MKNVHGVAFPKKGGNEYISVQIVPLRFIGGNRTDKTGTQESFQIRGKTSKDVKKIKEFLEYAVQEYDKFCLCKNPHDIAGLNKWCNYCSKPIKNDTKNKRSK